MAEPASTRARQGADTRRRILEAARQVLAEHGLEGFTTRRVAALAGVSHGMCHYHFKNKRDLVLALIVNLRQGWIEPLEALADGPGTAESRMRAVIAWIAEPVTTDTMRVHSAIYAAALSDDVIRDRFAQEYERWRAPFVRLYRALGEDLGLESLDARSVGEAFAAAADGLVEQQAIDPALPTEAVLTRLFEQTLVGGGARPSS